MLIVVFSAISSKERRSVGIIFSICSQGVILAPMFLRVSLLLESELVWCSVVRFTEAQTAGPVSSSVQ